MMFAVDPLDNAVGLGWVLVALVLAIGILTLISRGKIRKLTIGAGKVRADIDIVSLHSEIRAMKEAVEVITTEVKNGKATTLVERVDRIERNMHWQNDTLKKIAHHVGFVPTEPDSHRENTQGEVPA